MDREISMRQGSILLLILMSIVMMSLATSTYLVLMRNEHRAAHNAGEQLQARMFVESASDYLCVFLDQTDVLITQQGGLLANPASMQGILVADDLNQQSRGRFTVIAPDAVQGYYSGIRYGLEDESSKLNINLLARSDELDAARDRLLMLPGITAEIADAILDWIDEDNLPRPYGAEDTHYQGLNPAYLPANTSIRSLSELLQVRGVTPEVLYGLDRNRNFLVDQGETARGQLLAVDNSLGQINRGLSAYLTTYSAERLLDPAGAAKVNVNDPDLRALHTALQQVVDAEAANFIIAYRQFGPADGSVTGSGTSAASLTLDLDAEASNEINSLLDLIGVRVNVQPPGSSGTPGAPPGGTPSGGAPPTTPGAPASGGQVVDSPWQDSPGLYSSDFLRVLDSLTTSAEPALGGRININLASRPVLLTLSNLTEMQVDQILTMRETILDRQLSPQRHAIWLVANGVLTLDEMKAVDTLITTGGDVYSAIIVGFFDGQPATSRAHALFDRTGQTTLLVGWEDMTRLGPGFTPTELGAQVVTP